MIDSCLKIVADMEVIEWMQTDAIPCDIQRQIQIPIQISIQINSNPKTGTHRLMAVFNASQHQTIPNLQESNQATNGPINNQKAFERHAVSVCWAPPFHKYVIYRFASSWLLPGRRIISLFGFPFVFNKISFRFLFFFVDINVETNLRLTFV